MEGEITIYGKEDCEKCHEAQTVLADALYKDHQAIYDDFVPAIANDVVTSSNGQLPIIIIDTPNGMLQVSMVSAGLKCSGGSCTI